MNDRKEKENKRLVLHSLQQLQHFYLHSEFWLVFCWFLFSADLHPHAWEKMNMG